MTSNNREHTPWRDLRRAHWQRSVGTVLVRECRADKSERVELLLNDPGSQRIALTLAELVEMDDTFDKPWSTAFGVSDYIFAGDPKPVSHTDIPPEISSGVRNFTHTGEIWPAMEEAMNSVAYFPINLAYAISKRAEDLGVPGFKVMSLGDIAAIMLRPGYRTMVDQAALTKNSVWGTYSTSPSTRLPNAPDSPGNWIEFDEDGNERFTDKFLKFLKQQISAVNKRGAVRGGVAAKSSSGCPARRLQAQFTESSEDRVMLGALSEHFEKSPEELTKKHEKTVIDEELDLLADVLQRSEPVLNERLKETAHLSLLDVALGK